MGATVECRPIRLSYFLRIPNVGDRINPAIVTAISGHQTVHVTATDSPYLLAIGSVMGRATPQSHVWGSGVMHPDMGVGSTAGPHIHAVRGKLSHVALRQSGIAIGDIPLGDPAFLAPGLFDIRRSSMPVNKLGVVAHYVDRANPLFRRLLANPGVADLNVHQDPYLFLRQMAECEAVISSSLHGLIFAEALGIPNLWVTVSNEVAGGSFKFDDWFSTTNYPQAETYHLNESDAVDDLIERAATHGSMIDTEALKRAFPHQSLDELREANKRYVLPVHVCRERPTPVFLISFNRGEWLKQAIISLRQQSRPIEIVVHDNGSTDAETRAVLDRLEETGVRVFRGPPIRSAEELNNMNDTIVRFFEDWAEPSRYIVSDCDIDMTIAAPEALDVYDELLNAFRKVESVGPMLRIRDIPTSYPLFNRVMNRHIEQFWHRQPAWTRTSFGSVAYVDAVIDTTLAIHRAGEPYRRLKHSLRVYEPYEARHLDWYLESVGNDPYGQTSNPDISHWNNATERDRHIDATLEYRSFFAVRRDESGALQVYEERLQTGSMTAPKGCLAPIKPFSAASEQERHDRIRKIEKLRRAGGSDVARWQSVSSHHEAWQSRGKLLASYVRPGERVFEFGAGNSVVPAALPAGCTYVGSDVAPLNDRVMVLDLNAPSPARLRGYDVAVFSGVLEYVHHLPRLAAFLVKDFRSVVCSYAARLTSDSDELDRRRYSGWFNDFSKEEFAAIFASVGFVLARSEGWAEQTLFRWDKSQRS